MKYLSTFSFLAIISFCWIPFSIAYSNAADSVQIKKLIKKAMYVSQVNLDSAYLYMDEAIQLAKKGDRQVDAVYCFLKKADFAGWNGKFQDYHQFLQEAESYYSNSQLDNPIIYIGIQESWAQYYYAIGQSDKGVEQFKSIIKALEHKVDLAEEEYNILNRTYQWIADYQLTKGMYDDALESFRHSKSFESQRALKMGTIPNLKHHDRHIAKVYYLKNEMDKASKYYALTLEAFERDYQNPAKKNRLVNSMITLYLDIAVFYRERKRFDESLDLLQRSLALQKHHQSFMGYTYLEMGKTYTALEDHSKAKKVASLAFQAFDKQKNGEKSLGKASVLSDLGDLFYENSEYLKALEQYQKALINISPAFQDNGLHENPDINDRINSKKQLLSVFGKKSIVLYSYFEKTRDPQYLNCSWETIQTAINLIEVIRKDYQADADKQFLIAESYPIFEHAINLAFEMGESYYAKAFEYSEKSKAIILQEAVNKTYAEKFADLDPQKLDEINLLKAELVLCDQQIFYASTEKQAIHWQEKRFIAKKAIEEKIAKLERINKKYYQLKYRSETVSPQKIQQELLAENQAMISYFLGEKQLFIFLIDPKLNGLKIIRQDWNKQLSDYATTIKDDIFFSQNEDYVKKAQVLYQHLLQPVLSHCSAKKIILIPDGVLGYIPFNALLSQTVEEGIRNFKDLPYLIRDRQISQCFSATTLELMREDQPKAPKPRVLVSAPAFKKITSPTLAMNRTRDKLDTLVYNELEGELVSNLLTGLFQRNKQATKASFLLEAPKYNILHIASHAKVNDAYPNFSYIAFSNLEADQNEDFKLYIRELYNCQLSAELVVLSACETGGGKVFKGEGIVSIARAFMYAGAKSITTSLWNIDDKQTQELMYFYYQHLANGEFKDEALANAQKDYLAKAVDQDRAHPKYWAAFASIGDTRPLLKKRFKSWPFLLVLAGVGLIYIVGKKKEKRSLQQQSSQV